MSIEAEAATGGVISTRNGVPPDASEATPARASDPPGGTPRHPDPDPRPHPAPGEPQPQPEQDLPADEPPHTPPRREAQGREAHERDEHETRGNHRNHHGKHK